MRSSSVVSEALIGLSFRGLCSNMIFLVLLASSYCFFFITDNLILSAVVILNGFYLDSGLIKPVNGSYLGISHAGLSTTTFFVGVRDLFLLLSN